ncbi:MAG TPA: hypothetical protein V6D28_27740 [Leptolyngbyaceae cyanobacterium]
MGRGIDSFSRHSEIYKLDAMQAYYRFTLTVLVERHPHCRNFAQLKQQIPTVKNNCKKDNLLRAMQTWLEA